MEGSEKRRVDLMGLGSSSKGDDGLGWGLGWG